jgi:hypothetical protein
MKIDLIEYKGHYLKVTNAKYFKKGMLVLLTNDYGDQYIVRIKEKAKDERNFYYVHSIEYNREWGCRKEKLKVLVGASKELNLDLPEIPILS